MWDRYVQSYFQSDTLINSLIRICSWSAAICSAFFHIAEHKHSDVQQKSMQWQASTVAEKTAVKCDQWCQTRYQLIFIVRHTVYRNSLLLSASNLTCRTSEYWCNVFCTFPRSSATSAAERFFDVSVVKALQSQAPFDCVKCAACSLLNIC